MRRAAEIILLIIVGLIGLTSPPAVANQIVGATGETGCTGGLNIHDPDDVVVGYQRSALASENQAAVQWVMLNRVLPTDLEVGEASSGGDFVYIDGAYTTFCNTDWWTPQSGGTTGKTICSSLTGNACNTHKVYLTTTWTSGQATGNVRKLVCHETGHAIGITHNAHTSTALNSCMKAAPTTGISEYSSSHEVADMINYVW